MTHQPESDELFGKYSFPRIFHGCGEAGKGLLVRKNEGLGK